MAKIDENALEQYVKSVEEPEDQTYSPADSKPSFAPFTPRQNKQDQYKDVSSTIGYQSINIEDLPTQGMFYPVGTSISIRPAKTGEIRHWSTIDESNISNVDDKINFIMDKCVIVKFPKGFSSWKDLKEIDRLYILLSVREYTFIESGNNLMVPISETESIPIQKEMIDFMTMDDRLMKYYNSTRRMFEVKLKNGKVIDIFVPSVGVIKWLKEYIIRKNQEQQQIDVNFIEYVPFLVEDYKQLGTPAYYERLLSKWNEFSREEISVLVYIKELFNEIVNPQIKYYDEAGGEQTAPLMFQGGLKSLFIITDVESLLE